MNTASPVYLSALGITAATGSGLEATCESLGHGKRLGMVQRTGSHGTFTVGQSPIASSSKDRIEDLLDFVCQEIEPMISLAIQSYGRNRIAVILGSTDNGSQASFKAVNALRKNGQFPEGYNLGMQSPQRSAEYVRSFFGLESLALGISTACTSSASAIIMARRLIRAGIADVVIAGGADIVSESVLYGFHALEAVDREPCRPFSANRGGINLGEAAALFVVSKTDLGTSGIILAGAAETSDAHHMTAPDPEGIQASKAMDLALADAQITAQHIDYLNLHGTGTQLNDAMESKASRRVFGPDLPCSTTKGQTGHTLGAAGAVEAAFCWLLLQSNGKLSLPIQCWDGQLDKQFLAMNIVSTPIFLKNVRYCMTNNFAFGGCNTSMILGKV